MDAADVKVVLISNGFQPNYEKGYANGLAANGIDVELIGSDRTLYADLRPEIRAINLRGSQNPRRSRLAKLFNLLTYLFKLHAHLSRIRPRTLHLTGMLLGGTGWAALAELGLHRLESRRLWLTVHNLVPHGRQEQKGMFVRRWLYRIPHILVVHTNKMRQSLIETYGVPEDRIIVMQHGADDIPDAVSTVSPERREDELRVLLFGAILPYKGVDIFLQALHYCRDVRITATIAGDTRDLDYASRVQEWMNTVPAPHQVEWKRGYVPESALPDLFAEVDVVALPYRRIDQSGVLFTAYRFGVPVLCFDVGAFREYVPAFAGRIVDEQSPKSLAKNLGEFRREIGRYDRTAILDYARSFAWEKTVRVLLPQLA